MKLRKLEEKDAPLMLEWMHDESVVGNLHTNFAEKTIDDCLAFIEASKDGSKNLHLAIANDEDEYQGTVSLKHIDYDQGTAEFAITVRSCAMGHGYSWFGQYEILKKAFDELNLQSVYWCVSRKNERAVKYYDKHNFHEVVDIPPDILARYEGEDRLKWYAVLAGDEINIRESVAGCRIINIKTIPTVGAGELSFFEANHDIGFDIKRIYYISKVLEGMRRGFHAHKELKQLLFCPYGAVQMVLDNGTVREEITLNDPSVGIIIDKPTWREMLWLQKDSVLCVAASDYYNAEDYIRDFDEFVCYVEQGE